MTKRARSGSLGRAAPPSFLGADTVQVATPALAVNYLEDIASNSKFHVMLDEFMKRFNESFEATAREHNLKSDFEIKAAIAVPVPTKASEPENSKANVAPPVVPVPPPSTKEAVSKTTTTTQSGSSFDVITVKNDKIQAGFLLPKKDKVKTETKTTAAKEKTMEAGFLLPKKGITLFIFHAHF